MNYVTMSMKPGLYETPKEYCRAVKSNRWACLDVPCPSCMFWRMHPEDDSFEEWNLQGFMDLWKILKP